MRYFKNTKTLVPAIVNLKGAQGDIGAKGEPGYKGDVGKVTHTYKSINIQVLNV